MRTGILVTLGLVIPLMGTLAAPAKAAARLARRSRLPQVVALAAIGLAPFVGPAEQAGAVTVAPGPKTNPVAVFGEGSVNTSLGAMLFEVRIVRETVGGPITGGLAKFIRGTDKVLVSQQITDLVILDPNRVLVKGTCAIRPIDNVRIEVVQEGCTFVAIFQDGHKPDGGGDSFQISTNGGPFVGGALTSGNVVIATAITH